MRSSQPASRRGPADLEGEGARERGRCTPHSGRDRRRRDDRRLRSGKGRLLYSRVEKGHVRSTVDMLRELPSVIRRDVPILLQKSVEVGCE
jgi:hypothetical protein